MKLSKRACCCSTFAAAGFARFDPFDLNTQPEPPDGELAQAV